MLYQADFLKRLEAGLRVLLPEWGMAPDAALKLLTISENATYLAEDVAGRRLVLRVQRPEYHSLAEIESELAWISALRESGLVSTPAPVGTVDGRALSYFVDGQTLRHVAAFEWMPGSEPEPGDQLIAWYRVLGQINARLHQHSRSWQRPQGFARKVWNFDTIIGERAYWGDWRNALGLTAEGREVLERTQALLREQTEAYGMAAERFGLVHCDMRLANLLVDGERLTVIDFDDCGFSWFVYDFAACLSFLEEDPRVGEFLAAWLGGYRSVAPLSEEDERVIPTFLMLRRMQLTAWVASHAETPTAQSMGEDYTRGTVALAQRYLDIHSEDTP
ncbi:phosphotransferase enzyme family protein [Pseudomonas lopnurensis]|uniref:phosphotransferase enzyme family protein n=1 Tax=Pseudomonas lopnurensis TaxID=1477517 RepID=UPI0028ADB16D|nr:phosphotransferase [Pseudomonas lopnurensis]